MAGMFADPLTARIVDFLIGIGIPVEAAELPDDTFLPGIALERGTLLVDEARLAYPGDLLHEAGHIAATPAWARPSLSGAIEVPGLDTSNLEWAAVPWSYAAACAIGIDPVEVFHAGGYRGHSPGLLTNFAAGVPIGVHLLEDAGMTAGGARAAALGVPPYPHMLRWLRD
jgi:hypothetical protein